VENQRLEIGLPRDLDVESFGEPGSRTFRLLAATGEGRVSLWLEKEQIVMLGSAIESLLERVPEAEGNSPESPAPGALVGDLEVRVGSLSIGYDASLSGFTLEATDFTSEVAVSSISLTSSRRQLVGMAEQIRDIVAAGRPRCPLCGRAITDGRHFCPESNGHARVASSR
jgi:uncharacterized repeat protein (TIGR03847 family)